MAEIKAEQDEVILRRAWAMPNKNTFSIKPFKELIETWRDKIGAKVIVDPFANTSKFGTVTNDIDPSMPTDYHMNAKDFLQMFEDNSVDMVLYDPPFSPNQVKTCYTKLNMTVDWESTSASFWSQQKAEIGRILKQGGICITFGWNSGGVGKKYGMETREILFVAHGGGHNDTFAVVDEKIIKNDAEKN